MSSWMQNIVTRPILAIAPGAREVVGSAIIPPRSEDEAPMRWERLVDSFNDMLAEIDRRTRELGGVEREARAGGRGAQPRRAGGPAPQRGAREQGARTHRAAGDGQPELESFSYSVSPRPAALRCARSTGSAGVGRRFPRAPSPAKQSATCREYAPRHSNMAQLIEDLLKLARVSRGPLERRTVDLGKSRDSWWPSCNNASPAAGGSSVLGRDASRGRPASVARRPR